MARFTLTVKITCHKANPFSWKTIIVYKLHRHCYLLWVFISVNGTFGCTPEIEVLCHTRPFLYILCHFIGELPLDLTDLELDHLESYFL